mmetsp:Transcript_21898/g.38753  ORF Transcript_21898/g.38753 Transcript_21898/m.38753 type:complete len:211 (-) Transcript_21898:200-832(-)
MACAANGRRLHGGGAAEAEVVQLEDRATWNAPHFIASRLQSLVNGEFLVSAVCANCHGIPHLHKKSLQEVRQPEALGIRVDHREEHCLRRDHHALWDSLDGDGKLAAVLLQDVLPALLVEEAVALEVFAHELLGLVDLRPCDHLAQQVALQEVLQSEENHAVPALAVAAAALEVAVDILCSWWVLLPVAELVAVCRQDKIVSPAAATRNR